MPHRSLNITQITRAAVAFVVVAAAHWGYVLLAVPLIEPVAAERTAKNRSDSDSPSEQVTRHAKLLESLYPDESAWQRRRPKIVETDQAVLLLKDYRTLEDGRMEIKPCTLLFIKGGGISGSNEQPSRVVVLDAPEGAVLQFDNDLDIRRAEFGRLVGGRLVGQVTIRSNESAPGASDQIYLATRNVNMDEQRVWTPHEVSFRYGGSYGSGRDLIMTLLPASDSLGKQRGPNIGGLKSLELVHLDRLHLVAPKKADATDSTPDDSQAAQKRGGFLSGGDHESPVEITCQGPFLFDLENGVATFEEQVDVLRLNRDGPSDQLNCRLLEIYFNAQQASRRKGSSDQPLASSSLQKVVALGYPVVLTSPSLEANARCERLEYDLELRQFRLDGEQAVMLEHQDRKIEALAVQYQLPEQGRVGRAWAQGPGRFRAQVPNQSAQESPRTVTASWQDELLLQPDGDSHVLSLKGDARVGDGTFGGLAANEIHLWLKESPAKMTTEKEDANSLGILPDRLLAVNEVKLDSPALTGSTERFEVWFHHVPQETMVGSQPDSESQQFQRFGGGPQERPVSRFDVSGDVLRVLLAAAGKRVQLRDVSVEGNARIVESKTASPDDVPVKISGDFAHVTGADSLRAKAVVAGKPAKVSGRGVTLKGASIHLDRASNRVWVPDAGEAILPLTGAVGLTSGGNIDRERQAIARHEAAAAAGQTENAVVTWQEGMQFDGQTIQVRGRVLAKTKQQRLTAPLVDVSLTRRIEFGQISRSDAIEVEEIRLRGQVTMENRTVEEGQLISIDEMMVRDLTIDQLTGRLSADGPGWIKSVRRGGDLGPQQFAGPAFGNTGQQPNAEPQGAADDGLTYLRVTFQSAMKGNVHARHVQLSEGVRTVYGKVEEWNDTIDADRALDSEQDVVLLTSDTLQVAETSGGVRTATSRLGSIELQALGNATVEGPTFTARAHRIAYAQAKDLLVMEGDGRTDAELYRQSHTGGQTGRAAARKILYWPGTGRMDVDTFNSLDWTGGIGATQPENPLPSGVGDYLQRERASRPERVSTPPR